MSKFPEIYEGFVSDDGNVFKYTEAIGVEVHDFHKPIEILRMRRIYKWPLQNFWFKSPKKIKNYVPVRIIVEYL